MSHSSSMPYAPPVGQAFVGPGTGPVGTVRGTGAVILLMVVTLGFYSLYWWFKVHQEMKEHSGIGLGGVLALVLAVFASPVMAFLTPHEIGTLRERAGQAPRVSAVTGLWYVPGCFIVIGPLVWFVKTNAAINDYWRSVGAS